MKVLLVDEDHQFLVQARELLLGSRLATQVITCTSGREALVWAESQDPDVLVVAVCLPRMEGLKTIKEINRQTSGRPIIIAVVDQGHPGIRERVLAQGAHDYLEKPQGNGKELLKRIKAAIGNRGEILTPEKSGEFSCHLMDPAVKSLTSGNDRYLQAVILDSMADMVVYHDIELRVVWANRAACSLVGETLERLIGRYCYEIWHGRKEPCPGCPVVLSRRTGEPEAGEMVYPEGRVCRVQGYPVRDKAGRITGFVEVSTEMTAIRKAQADLHREKERLAVTLRSIGDAVIATDTRGCVTLVNKVAEKLTGWTEEEARGAPLRDVFRIIDGKTRQECENPVDRVLTSGSKEGLANHTVLLSRDGREICIDDSGAPIRDRDGNIVGAVLVFRDITEKKAATEKLRVTSERLETVLQASPLPIITLDKKGRVDLWNSAAEKVFGWSAAEVRGRFNPVVPPDRVFEYRNNLKQVFAGKTITGLEAERCRKDGAPIHVSIFTAPLRDNAGGITGVMVVYEDITERKKIEASLQYLSLHDPLTGVYNRTYFEQEMVRLDKENYLPVAIVVLDIDGLKLINDIFGHDTGDEYLRRAVDVIKKSFQPHHKIARIGGDEFAVLIPDAVASEVKEACRQVREMIDDYNSAEPGVLLSVSLGYALRRDEGIAMTELFKTADDSMYRAKLQQHQSNRNHVVSVLIKALETRDYITQGHGSRLRELVSGMARMLDLSERMTADLQLLAQFHDIGKVGIPDHILFKPGRLTPVEYKEIQRHCEIGHRIALSTPELAPIADQILKHHEWWDGSGYPLGIKGIEIPLECRILAIADAYDTMVSDRPYRRAERHEIALWELHRCAGTQFDPVLVTYFADLLAAAREKNESRLEV